MSDQAPQVRAGFSVPWLAAGVGGFTYFSTGDPALACAAFAGTILAGIGLVLGLAAAILALVAWAGGGKPGVRVRRR